MYFVAAIGDDAVAGVGAAGTLMFIVMALTQVLGVGAVALISQAAGRKDQPESNLIFNQSLVLAALCAAATLAGGYGITGFYIRAISADAATQAAGMTFLYWFIPGLALQFALVTMGSALRGTGIVKPAMIVQVLTAFSPNAEAQAVGAGFLRIISWNFIAQGFVFTCSGIFQGLGNTRPALLSSSVRLGFFVPIAVWLTTRPNFELEQVWWLSAATVFLQAGVSYMLMQNQFRRRLVPREAAPAPL